jgi:putative ABC transport system permease protein
VDGARYDADTCVRALDIKLFRDLAQMRGQVITIALVVACGIGSYVAVQGAYFSIVGVRDAYYERHRFPDVFAPLERAPRSLLPRLQALPGVALAYARVVERVSLPLAGRAEPATGHLIGVPTDAEPALGSLMLREGRLPLPGRADEVVVLEAFAHAHGLDLGSRLPAVIAGIERELRIVGIALAPEYVFAISPGEVVPDARRFGALWMDREVVEVAFRMQGAFNELLVRLQPGASERKVIEALNAVLEPYGALGAYGKGRQLSNQVLQSDLSRLRTLTALLPVIFLGVAAFLLNVVLSRLVQLQRPQIATLKAIGYSHRRVGLHYLELAIVVVLIGAGLGLPIGVWLGGRMTDSYQIFFHFPDLQFQVDPRILTLAAASSLIAALAGALANVRAVMRLPPAEAMRPQPPASYRRAFSERLRISFLFGPAASMVLRELERWPVRLALSITGVALAVALLIAGRFGVDAVEYFMYVHFDLAERDDVSVSFRRPVDARALRELEHLPGVLRAEGVRLASVRFRNGHRSRESMIAGYEDDAELRKVLDNRGQVVPVPEQGIVINTTLARILGISAGEDLVFDVLEGARGQRRVRIARVVDEVFGLFGHMRARELARLLGDEGPVSMALLRVDPRWHAALTRALRARPDVLGVNQHDATIEMFERHTAGQMRFTTLIMTLFASVIACGVIYNNARIALATRSRDLASLRVLGFRRSEISAILLGELAVQVLCALPLGLWLGRELAEWLMAQSDPELYRFPVVISTQTYSFAVLVTLAASLVSALLVRRSLDRLDLVAVLKSRE